MFDIDKWQEIFNSIRRHKLRTFLTALGVFWGIFMLVLLLGMGQGLHNGLEYQFRDDALNSIWLRRGQTSIPYNGLPKGRRIQFANADYDFLVDNYKDVEHITGRVYLSGERTFSYNNKTISYPVRSVHPGHLYVENTIMTSGRYINEKDIDEYRKVTVLGKVIVDDIFKEEDPVGKEVKIGDVMFTVVGTFEDSGGENEMRRVYIPITTAQKVYAGEDVIHQLMFTTGDLSLEETEVLQENIRAAFAARHQFDVKDKQALRISNVAEEYQIFQNMFLGIRLFIWFIGIGSIFAGVIGVGNIMLIIVKDRTKEIGIRKALGATPRSIISMILLESVFITSIAGYLGMLCGIGIIGALGVVETPFFRHPEIYLGVAITATIVLVIAGALAGLMPAMQAARINPVKAIKD